MARRQRDYAAEYAKRVAKAKGEGWSSYREKRNAHVRFKQDQRVQKHGLGEAPESVIRKWDLFTRDELSQDSYAEMIDDLLDWDEDFDDVDGLWFEWYRANGD